MRYCRPRGVPGCWRGCLTGAQLSPLGRSSLRSAKEWRCPWPVLRSRRHSPRAMRRSIGCSRLPDATACYRQWPLRVPLRPTPRARWQSHDGLPERRRAARSSRPFALHGSWSPAPRAVGRSHRGLPERQRAALCSHPSALHQSGPHRSGAPQGPPRGRNKPRDAKESGHVHPSHQPRHVPPGARKQLPDCQLETLHGEGYGQPPWPH
mmetsp:Transcript_23000/g.71332  ORF Transcript_23000/g.71332 Transcript_23000/m.71332 type:complete len:208 (+) Transcript_23000:1784-2407(+)